MDRERLFRHLEQRYSSKREMISRIPLGTQADALWQELLSRRRAKSTVLPIYSCFGLPYWYVTTDKMVSASEKIVDALFENETDFDPYTEAPPVATLEEVFYTSFVDGSQMTMQEAMSFLEGGSPPRDVEEQLIANNRQAAAFATANLYHAVDEEYLRDLVSILVDGLEAGTGEYRTEDWILIHSMPDDQYTLPPARTIPDRMRELLALLEDPRIHPLIKAGVAQAWMLVIRPFPEGNERLGRLLSMIVLLRAGYAFFSDVSLSALTARKSYGYYEAIENILREENGGDLTYFMEYYLELLARAVDERRLRMEKQKEDVREAEIELAHMPLTPPHQQEQPADDPQQELEPAGSDPPEAPDEVSIDLPPGAERVKEKLLLLSSRNSNTIPGRTAGKLVEYIDRGKFEFTTGDIHEDFGLLQKTRNDTILMLREAGLIEQIGTRGRFFLFRFSGLGLEAPKPAEKSKPVKKVDPDKPKNTPPLVPETEVLGAKATKEQKARVKMALLAYANNHGDSAYTRTAVGLVDYVERGKIRFKAPDIGEDFGLDRKRRVTVTRMLQQCGLIAPVAMYKKFYIYGFIIPEATETEMPVELEKPVVTEIPDKYDDDEPELDLDGFFNQSPLPIKSADYAPEILESIRELSESERSARDRRIGSLLEKNLSSGLVTSGLYDEKLRAKIWPTDMQLAEQMGIVDRITDDSYRIRKTVRPGLPHLDGSQKAMMTKMFKEFGDGTFSREMVTASLDYSKAHACAMLHQFTLIRILDCRKDEEKGVFVYQLRVNPEEHPECFVKAA